MAIVLPLAAQEGFPLKGSWLGDWGTSATARNQVFIVFDWDGKAISGAINPGTDMIVIKNASLTPTPVGGPPAGTAAPGGGGGGGRAGGGRGGGGGQGGAAAAPAAGGAATPAAGAGGGGGRGGGGQGGAPAAPAAGGAAAPAAGAAAAPAAAGAQGGGGRGGNTLGAQSGGTLAPASTDWVVHFEGDGKDSKGATVHYVADGKIENIGLYNRILAGTWVSGNDKGTFRIQRQ